ncbi:2-C-methyl-D-erythritol 4-phosphate cytidylyltransferase [Microbacterium sp. LRZ72]|uniref:2-C-methyl-D-erythritol 4-phosphate cytidylyltransferase n=1 Tax=Microbacterium sp. LRZ72 TaxID=2942481 RepID=UPI0029B4AE42|nr:2-C-methyl-D-erythritol 4-phosphate cytidylyltransferase [Microbacterium sp. LRZ72]MDX2375950.1 2-C-methyl-D-erythritol 4-phosphate cytidylyltransferase [Microbacterium sp. LRZ72]
MTVTPTPRIAVIVVAAGSGTRLDAGGPKALVGIDEHSILRHALRGVFAAPTAQVVIVAPADREGDALTEAYAAADEADAVHPLASGRRRDLVGVVVGGSTRQRSVAAGLRALWADVDVVLVHDAARALTPAAVFERVIDAVDASGAGVVPVLPVIDTLKRVESDAVVEAVDRTSLTAAQTPQGFPRPLLEAAYAAAEQEFTDDTALVAAHGVSVRTVDGDERAFKITTRGDLSRAQMLVTEQPAARAMSREPAPPAPAVLPRVGVGTDVHAFGGDGELWLAGLRWKDEPALSGHSDGDAVSHAVVDALLSAAGLGDIGSRFGTSRPEYAGAHADVFLDATRVLLHEAGWRVGNVAVQVQANRPRFAARRAEAEAALSTALGGAPVSVSATTTDGLGFTGRGDGVSAFAVALLLPR